MAYTKTIWKNDQLPAINEGNLNNIENGIEKAHNNIDKVNNNIGELSQLNTENKDNLVNAINEVNCKSLIKVSKSSNSSFELGKYGFTKVPLTVQEIKIGEKFALQDGSIVNVSGKTLNVRVYFVCIADVNIKDGYMIVAKNDVVGDVIPFTYTKNMNSCSELTTILQLSPNDKLYIKIGNSTSTSVKVNKSTFIAVEEI